ncbi:MAG: Putative subunit of Alternative cytochrome c oxidase [Cytophagales bacterium]|jgi:cytochrome c oxidase subunit IV|nr:cytochrome C oxidase subunit IV family protein [Bacteroidota bacterium]MBS1981953.1 cytochrome C oxidase subunit IV family protein [Bacteroidota bacterium]WHZ09403.1 MAG: Putative subunit of Alternative cytochrome c oxidase [Cytophagales bacterium]
MEHHSNEPQVVVIPPDKEKIAHLWKVAGIMLVVTIFEFIVAFSMHSGVMKTSIFVGMTIIKAFYIVGEFMHLRHEVKALIWSIMVPIIFIVWMLIALVYEGTKMADINFLSF